MKEFNKNYQDKKTAEKLFVEIIKGTKHKLYDKTVKLRKDYISWLTGVGLDSFIRTYDKRESSTDADSRKQITKHILPRVAAKTRDSYYKALRNNNINIDIEKPESEQFDNAMALFHHFDSLDEYWMNRYKELQFTDPNGWIVVDFYTLPDKTLKPYLREVTSEMAINYKYENGKLKYLVFKQDKTYFYFSEKFVMSASLQETAIKEEVQADDFGNIMSSRANVDGYTIISAMYPFKEAFAFQIGYLRDPINPDLFVSPLEKARPDVERLISQTSEYDINLILHVFLQKFEYADVCKNEGCNKGAMPDGSVCPECKGTGYQKNHESGIDTVKLPLPRDAQDMLDLQKLVHYVQLPVEVLKIQKEEMLYSINEIEKTAINADIFTRSEVAQTATEKNLEMQNVYDVLYPYAIKYCQSYQFIVEKIADILKLSDKVNVSYNVDKDMKLKSVTEQLAEIGKAIENNVPVYILNEMMDKLAQTEFRNDTGALLKYEVKRKFSLTNGLTAQEKALLLAGLPSDNEIRIQVLFFEYLFTQCEMKQPEFYTLTYEQQKALFDIEVKAMQEKMKVPQIKIEFPE